MQKHIAEIAGQNGQYLSKPCTAKELLEWIKTVNLEQVWKGPHYSADMAECINACRDYLEWYSG